MAAATEQNDGAETVESSQLTGQERLRNDMIEHIVNENKAFFRSQQINDPEITRDERRTIVSDILAKSQEQFLSRFGHFIRLDHLAYFESDVEKTYELNSLLRTVQSYLRNRTKIVKNRRYAALQHLLDQNEYFSEMEMMRREPYLYDQLVGQYLTANERNQRDAMNVDGPEFSNVLLHGIDMKNIECLRKQQLLDETNAEEVDGEDSNGGSSESKSTQTSGNKNDGSVEEQMFPEIPPNYRQHWGDFDDESNSAPPSVMPTTHSKVLFSSVSNQQAVVESETKSPTSRINSIEEAEQQYVSADEKDQLRKEFFSMMCENFLQGKDATFDYATVDESSEYDDIDTENQDAEDKYFDGSDDDDDASPTANIDSNEPSDDELDIYMKNVSEDKNGESEREQ